MPLHQPPASGTFRALCIALAVDVRAPCLESGDQRVGAGACFPLALHLGVFRFQARKTAKTAGQTVKRVKRVSKSVNRSVQVKTQRRKTPSVRQVVNRAVRGNAVTAPVQGLRFDAVDEPLAPVVKLENAKTVLVVGDFMAGAVAEGLIEAFEDSENIKIVEKWNGSSGFVRNDYYDWPASLPALIAEIKPSAVIIMLGTNDRQQLLAGGERSTQGTPAWSLEYEKRVRGIGRGGQNKRRTRHLGRPASAALFADDRIHARLQRHLPPQY